MQDASRASRGRAGRLPRATAVSVAAVLTAGMVATPAAGSADDIGAPGVGDSYFPRAGNGGYDVEHYDLALRYDPDTDQLHGTARIELTATQDLERFNLDLRRPLKVRSVVIDGDPAAYDRKSQELRITPEPALGRTDEVTVVVRYRGNPGNPVDITGSPFGWWTTDDGAMVANEADGASTWFPANDHPTDKATFSFDVTLPKGSSAVANGDFRGSEPAGAGWSTWRWRQREPMATYLATATVGDFEITRSRGPGGLPIIDAIDKDLGDNADDGLVDTSAQLEFYSDTFGPYPFESYGAIVDDDSVGYALETQNRPIYSGPPSSGLVAHEMAHQWFGDSVTLGRWQDIWLNEGFATYSTWLWSEHRGGASPADRFAELYQLPADDPEWLVAPGDPGVLRLFDGAVYWRGAMTLQAIRETVGDDDFFAILRAWARTRADGDGTTPQLERLAEDVSGKQLDKVFDDWLYLEGKPRGWDRADPGDVVLDDVPDSHLQERLAVHPLPLVEGR